MVKATVILWCALVLSTAVTASTLPVAHPSCTSLMISEVTTEAEAFRVIHSDLTRILPREVLEKEEWFRLLEQFALPQVQVKSQLAAIAIIGGGNAGKSTLMNALPSLIANEPELYLGEPITESGFYPGLTKRVVIALHESHDEVSDDDLRARFGEFRSWTQITETTRAGPPLVVGRKQIPRDLAFIDSPDFDTGQIDSSVPDNLEKALAAIRPSDAILAIVDGKTIRNHANVHLLNRLFTHYGPKQTILVFTADPAMTPAAVRGLLLELNRAIYGGSDTDFSSAVLGAYIMPYDPRVSAGLTWPRLVPLEPYPPFAQLVRQMSEKSADLKAFALRGASSAIFTGAAQLLETHLKRRLAMQLLDQHVHLATEVAASESLENFDYDAVQNTVRDRFRSYLSVFRKLILKFGSLVAIPDRLLIGAIKQIQAEASLTQALAQNHNKHRQVAASQFINAVQTEVTPREALLKRPKGLSLVEATERYNELFPEEVRRDVSAYFVAWPPRNLFSAEVNRELNAIRLLDTAKFGEALKNQIVAGQFFAREESAPEINEALKRMAERETFRGGSIIFDLNTLVLPAIVGYGLYQQSFDNPLTWAAALILSSRPMRYFSDRTLDSFLRREMNVWYRGVQMSATTNLFSRTVTQSLHQRLHLEIRADDEVALLRLQRALSFLARSQGREYRILPLTP